MGAKAIDPQQFGVSFSLKQCRNFDLDPAETLRWLLYDAGFRRFRLMSYWNEHEKIPGKYTFAALDSQIKAVDTAGGVIMLCLGARQPRWPENHWPEWAWNLSAEERSAALLLFISVLMKRYKKYDCIISWQLENEALLKNFGERAEVNRQRLRAEYTLVKRLDPTRPIIMTTSTSWGIPLRRPIPDIVGFSYYHTLFNKGSYHQSTVSPAYHRLRKLLIHLIHRKPVFIHELQLEPWGPKAIWKMTAMEQAKSMNTAHIAQNMGLAHRIKAYPLDLWGGEWWYWKLQIGHDPTVWQAVAAAIRSVAEE